MEGIDRDEVLGIFLTESAEQLDLMENALLRLESAPDAGELLDQLFRAAHTFKGNAGVVGLSSLEAFTHSVEDVLERTKSRSLPVSTELVSLLLRAVDAFRRIVPKAIEGQDDPQPEHAEIQRFLSRRGRGKKSAPVPAPPPDLEPALSSTRDHSLRVDIGKLDRMLNLLGEITIARGRLSDLLAHGRHRPQDLRDAHHETDRLYLELQEQLMRARMVPLGPTFRRYARVVRDLAIDCGKQVDLRIEGEDVEVDTAVVEGIRDPLTHMVRNAIDHGIETPEERERSGKSPRGTITMSARHDGGSILITLRDDGRGLDRGRILARARQVGLVGDAPPSEAELLDLIFEPGFSTADTVTELSGRGIGMNVVRENIEALRGTVTVASADGDGTEVSLRLPLTLAIIEGFSVAVGGETYVLPLDAVVECVELPAHERQQGAARGVVSLRGEPLPYLRLSELFDVERAAEARESLVVLQHDGHRAGLAVDALHGAGQTVIKPLAAMVERSLAVAGCALLGSGRVALILDVPALFKAAVAAGTTNEGAA